MAGQDERRTRGAEQFRKIYHDVVPIPEPGTDEFVDLMLSQVFAEVWSRPALSIRERRLLVMGAIAAMGEFNVFGIQAAAALQGGELDAEQLREAVLQLTQYVGYPRAGGLRKAVETAIVGQE